MCQTNMISFIQAGEIIQAIKDFNGGIGQNETSADGLFTLQEVECLGACANAPMIQVNNEWFYEDLDYDAMTELMQKWKNGEEPITGPQNGRINACGIQGRTTLETIPEGTIDRDWAGELKRYEDAKAEAARKKAEEEAAKAAAEKK